MSLEQCLHAVNRISNCMDVYTPAAVNAATNKVMQDDELWIITLIAVLIGLPMILMRLLKMCARVSWAHRKSACGLILLGIVSAAQWIEIIFSAVGQLMNEMDQAGKRSGV